MYAEEEARQSCEYQNSKTFAVLHDFQRTRDSENSIVVYTDSVQVKVVPPVLYHTAPHVLGRKNQAAHNMLHIAFLRDERQHLLLDSAGTTGPPDIPNQRQPMLTNPMTPGQHQHGQAGPQGAFTGCGLEGKDEDLPAECNTQARCSLAKEPAPPQIS